MPDITNYAYLWYNEENPLSEIPTADAESIFQIVTTFSYPCYLTGSHNVDRLTPEEKHQLLHNEIGFIRDRMREMGLQGITIVQIPRVLYDLLSLIYFVQKGERFGLFEISCEEKKVSGTYGVFNTYSSYLSEIKKYLGKSNFKEHILELNRFILNKIHSIVGGGAPPRSYILNPKKPLSMKMDVHSFDDSFDDDDDDDDDWWETKFGEGSKASKASKAPEAPKAPKAPEATVRLEDIRSFLSDRNRACVMMLEDILKADYIYFPQERILSNFRLDLTRPTKTIFRQVLRFELRESSGYTVLYRGSVLENDSLIRELPDGIRKLQSVSFNPSILSGCVNDDTACTLFYMEPTSTYEDIKKSTKSGQNDKIIYRLKKFLKGDNSIEDSLFFIPPLHPLLQLNTSGELFHPRTKVNLADLNTVYEELKKKRPGGINLQKEKMIGGLACIYPFIQICDYLHSDKNMNDLNALYQRFKATRVVDKWYTDDKHQRQYQRSRKARESASRKSASRGRKRLRLLKEAAIARGEENADWWPSSASSSSSSSSPSSSSSARSPSSSRSPSSPRSSRSSRSSSKRMRVTNSVDTLRGGRTRKRTCKRMRLR